VRFAFIDAEKAQWPVDVQCETLGVSRSGYYAWKGRPEAPRAAEDAELVDAIKAAHEASRATYGSPRVHRELRAKGRRVGRKRVERLMRQQGIVARRKRRFRRTTDSKHGHPVAPNVLDRNFDAELPNTAWVTDVTYVWTHEGWLYLAAFLDLFSRRVVGWAASANNDRALAMSALDRAVSARAPDAGLVHHSDRGSVYASGDYGDALTKIGAVKSMSRKGDCWDSEYMAVCYGTAT
jgi:putative transposase